MEHIGHTEHAGHAGHTEHTGHTGHIEHAGHTEHIGRTHITAITNQKGGVGKSTTAEALADGLALRGHSVLLIDLDPQGSVTLSAGAQPGLSAYEVMSKTADARDAVQRRAGRPDMISSSRNLARLDVELVATGKEYRLRERLAPILACYEHIIIDTPPALGILTINALTACTGVLIPAQADMYSLQGIGQLRDTLDAVREYTNPALTLHGVLLTRHNARSILSRDMTETAGMAAEKIGTFLYDAVIREGVALKEAQASQQSIFSYAPKSNAAADYAAFISEFTGRLTNSIYKSL